MAVEFHWWAVDLDVDDRDDLFRRVADALHGAGRIPDAAAAVRALTDREAMHTTALAGGVAIPHARLRTCTRPAVAAARLARGVEFGAPDGAPVDLVFLMLTPEGADEHLALLASIARILGSSRTVNGLRGAPDEDSFVALLRAAAET